LIGAGYGGPPNYGIGGYGAGGTLAGYGPSRDYYMALLTSQYQNAPNLNAWLAALLVPIIDMTVALGTFPGWFDINSASGVQLDALGQIVGASRTVGFQPSNNVSPTLNDATYRILLLAKIAQNQWDGHISSLYATWAMLFPGGKIAIIDNQNMTATIILSGVFTSIIQDLITHGLIVPRPEGVQYTYQFPVLPVFGFGPANAFIAGFGQGHWAGGLNGT
jgi:hypothetical protein